ncbi:Helix-turn-helix domain-containing protein [Pedococcus dokdonensis]|uniref:Helix-turn-helix domain-containing protein n=1 Tax=Pedococcus dokdonensis TaxID=443156 RepID=A0A1H0RVF7_9MICO|nr:helix-turn-helix transcriptional regulator [Pedococcus dokdonensis]SDP33339.1 Helix-turn-helix domain-containing protein [Pedococcus dokdonensis]
MRAATPLHLVQPTEHGSRSAPLGRAPGGRLPGDQEPLWREVVGARLRHLRRRRGLTLVEAAARAGISPQYLSEVERGRKDPSSEVLAAITGALGAQLVEVTHLASLDLRRQHSALAAPPPGEIRLSA